MDKNWNNETNSEENLSNMSLESLSLGQRLLSKCLKKTGISVSVRGIAVNTTSQIKTAGSAWKSEVKYESNVESKTGTLDDVSFPDLLGSSNRDVSVNNRISETSSVTNDQDRLSKEPRSTRYKFKHRISSVKSVASPGFHSSRDSSYSNSLSFRNSNSDDTDNILGTDFLMPGMKGNYPLGFTNFIGRGVESPPPPPPSVPYPANPNGIYQGFQQYATRLKSNSRPQMFKPNVMVESPTVSESNWMDNKSDGYNEAELTTAIDTLNHSILSDRTRDDRLTIKQYVSDKLSQPFLDLTNYKDNSLLLQESLTNKLDERLVGQLESRLTNQLESTLSNQLENTLSDQLEPTIHETLTSNLSPVAEKRKKDRYPRRKKPTSTSSNAQTVNTNQPNINAKSQKDKKDRLFTNPDPTKTNDVPTSQPPDSTAPPATSSVSEQPPDPKNDKLPASGTGSGRSRRSRHRPKSHHRDEDENWRNSANEKPQNNAVNSEKNTHERKYFKSKPKHKHQQNTEPNTTKVD
uniref:Ms1orf2 protein, putative n=1 Tax=Theileria annulata TaxID=5874 RepID=A0A3B0N2G1_THEAN